MVLVELYLTSGYEANKQSLEALTVSFILNLNRANEKSKFLFL